ncbi:D-ser-dehydrat domain-containing protein [Favolaschia claudopus]|uniref:D-ser-dehydrat domain-containing protein n=1 Tax=Favolaschia claudopus TaxID=2862362 RepID=A0AAW0D5L9_9AGAR
MATIIPPPPRPEPPTAFSLSAARADLEESLKNALSLAEKIDAAEVELARIIKDKQNEIEQLVNERLTLQQIVEQTRAYLSPIRRLPGELLRELFLWCFDGHPCCAWVLSAVCTTWRRQALTIPRIWSKIRLFTNQSSSPDTIRLWLERSGTSVPLDIEIYLRVVQANEPPVPAYTRRRRGHELFAHTFVSTPAPLFGTGPLATPGHLLVPHFTPSVTPFIVPQAPVLHPHSAGWDSPPPIAMVHGQPDMSAQPNLHWGHIAVYYLVQQMHRWERFVFRFDKSFGSITALKSITGSAPLLKEFEVSSASAVLYPQDWAWLPSNANSSTCSNPLPNLRTLTLQYAPFKSTASIFLQPCTQLTNLTLRALPGAAVPLDRLQRILAANAQTLTVLRLHFASAAAPVLPLPSATQLNALQELSMGGHHLLAILLDTLVLPALRALDLDFDAPREPLEETITALYTRATNPPLRSLSISYGPPNPPGGMQSGVGAWGGYYGYGGGASVVSWQFLGECGSTLEVLKVGGAALEGILSSLGAPDDQPLLPGNGNGNGNNGGNGGNGWACPQLRELHLRACHAHPHPHTHGHGTGAHDGVGRLVRMIDSRNPELPFPTSSSSSGGSPVRLTRLELDDCVSLGADVMRWLEGRVGKDAVVCVEPPSPVPGEVRFVGHSLGWM